MPPTTRPSRSSPAKGSRRCSTRTACSSYVASIDGRHPEVLFADGYDSDDVAALLADPQRETWSTSRVLPGRTPVFYEFPEQYLAQYPSRSSFVEQFGARAWTVGPLMAGDQVMGFFVVMFQKAHRFTVFERGFITTS